MHPHRKLAIITGALYLLTFATSIPALALKRSFLHGDGAAAELTWAVILELILALACIGTAVAFHPIGTRHSPALALGFVASRTLEATTVFTGVIALLALASTRTHAQLDTADTALAEAALTAMHDWAFLLGPACCPQ